MQILRMKRIASLAIVAAIIVGSAVGWWWATWFPPLPAVEQSVARYVTEDACAACLIRPQGLSAHPWFGSLPFYWYVPPNLTPARLEKLGIEELAIFTVQADDAETEKTIPAWAVAAKLPQPVDLPSLVQMWRDLSVAPQEQMEGPRPLTLDGRDCLQLPAGTFFPRRFAPGTLMFTNREGRPAFRGINVGRVDDRRQYIEGKSKTSAIFVLRDIGVGELVGEELPLELRTSVFLAASVPPEQHLATLTLRNSAVGISSQPIEIPVASLRNNRLNIPRAFMVEEDGELREVDLLEDLVSQGRLEVVITCPTPLVYLGFASDDLNVWRPEFEYAYANGDELIVAQSRELLLRMIQAAEQPLPVATRLSQTRGEIVADVHVNSREKRRIWKSICSTAPAPFNEEVWKSRLTYVSAAINLHSSTAASLRASFEQPQYADRAATAIDDDLPKWKRSLPAYAKDYIENETASSSLIGGSLGVNLNESLDAPTCKEEVDAVQAIIGDSLENVDVEIHAQELRIQFRTPASLRRLSETAQFALAKTDMALAKMLGEFSRVDQKEEIFQRVTDRLPDSLPLRSRRAHDLAFQSRFCFNRYEDQYAAFCRGAETLLDAIEAQQSEAPEALWILGVIITQQSRVQSRYVAFRELFIADEAFQRRLQRLVDISTARGFDDQFDLHLVGQRCMEEAIQRKPDADVAPLIFPLRFLAGPALAQALYAECLTEAGALDEALIAWQQAERMLREVGERKWDAGEHGTIDLNHWKDRYAELDEDQQRAFAGDPGFEQIALGREYDYWRARAELEALDALRPVHAAYAPLRDVLPIPEDLEDPALLAAIAALMGVARQHWEPFNELQRAYFALGWRSPLEQDDDPSVVKKLQEILIGIERD